MRPGPALLYELHGLRVRSALPLSARTATDAGDCDLRIDLEQDTAFPIVPAGGQRLAGYQNGAHGYVLIDTGDDYCFSVHGMAEFRIDRDLSRVRARLAPGLDVEIAGLLTTGALLAAVLTLAGQLVLHASAVEIDGRVIAIAGQSGMGKSTLAASLCAGGARLVTDDLLRIEPRADAWMCHAGSDEVRLRPGAAALVPRATWRGNRTTTDARVAARFETVSGERPLGAIIAPRLTQGAREGHATRLTKTEALMWLMAFPRLQGIASVEHAQHQMSLIARLAGSVPAFRVVVPWQQPCPAALIAKLLRADA